MASEIELSVTTNRGGRRVFEDIREVREFSVETARDLATLSAVIEDSKLDEPFVIRTLGLVNDLAFQLQQSIELMCEADGEACAQYESAD
jgi:hypothetical protein